MAYLGRGMNDFNFAINDQVINAIGTFGFSDLASSESLMFEMLSKHNAVKTIDFSTLEFFDSALVFFLCLIWQRIKYEYNNVNLVFPSTIIPSSRLLILIGLCNVND